LTDSDTALNCVGQLVMELQSAKDMDVRMKNGLIDGISIGYEVLDEAFVGDVRQLKQIKLWEISLVTFPANQFARVTDVKGLLRKLAGDDETAQKVLEVLPLIKAGRALSAANWQKLSDVVSLLQEFLAANDPNSEASKQNLQQKAAFESLINTIRSRSAAVKE
jgi:hypothetical protein